MSATLGQKVKFFRQRAGMSQLGLETAIGASNGSVSRIESDKTNPTKETLLQLSDKLHLNVIEKDYLFGFTDQPATLEEVGLAMQEVEAIMNEPLRLAYLIDDRSRVICVSQTFFKIMSIPEDMASQVRGISLSTLIFDPKFKILEHFNEEDREFIIYNYLKSFHVASHFLLDDPLTIESIDAIKSNVIARRLWQKVLDEDLLTIQDIKSRTISFHFFGKRIELVFSNTPLGKYRRFMLVEYVPTEEFKSLFNSVIE